MKSVSRRLRRLGLAAIILALPPALALAAFGPPISFSPMGSTAFSPKVGTAANGVSLVAWLQSNGSASDICLRRRSAAGTLGPVTTIAGAGNVNLMDMAVAADGDAIVVWSRTDGVVQARFRAADGTRSAITTISPASVPEQSPLAAIDADGDALIVWQRVTGSFKRIQARSWSKTGVLGPIQTLSTDGVDALSPVVAMEADGDALISWSRQQRIEARFRGRNGPLGAVTTLSADGAIAAVPDVAVDADGDAVFAWRSFAAGQFTVQLRARSRTGVLSAAQTIAPIASDLAPEVAISANGKAYVIWPHTVSAGDIRIRGRQRNVGGGLDGVETLSGAENALLPDVEMSQAGAVLVSWVAATPMAQFVIRARFRNATGTFRPIVPLSAPTFSVAGVDGALRPNGSALVVWSLGVSGGFRIEGKAGP